MTNRKQLENAIAALERQRANLGNRVVEASIAALQEQLVLLQETTLQMVTLLILEQNLSTWQEVLPIIEHYRGKITQQNEQRLEVLFGEGLTPTEQVENAVSAAFALQTTLTETCQMVCAIHTAEADLFRLRQVVGQMLEEVKTHPILSRSQEHLILISHESYQQVRGVVKVVPVKPGVNLTDRSILYWVKTVQTQAFRLEHYVIHGIETSLVGREAEIRHLKHLFNRTTTGKQCHVVTILGVQGVGKTRLLNEFAVWQELLPQNLWYLKGQTSLETSQLPYNLIRQLLSVRFQISTEDSIEDAERKLVEQIIVLVGNDFREQAHLIAQLIGLSRHAYTPSYEIAFEALTQFFLAIMQIHETPIVIHIDDLQWADVASLDLLQYLVTRCLNAPLFMIVLTRPSLYDTYPRWMEIPEIHTLIELRSLSVGDSYHLLSELLQRVDQLPGTLRDAMVSRSAGNPFYIEELVKLLIDEKIFLLEGEQWHFQAEMMELMEIPTTLMSVIQRRLNALPPEDHLVLNCAAVIGKVFSQDAVLYLVGDEQPIDGGQVFQSLVERGMIDRLETRQSYKFHHDLLYEVSYDQLPLRSRQKYHVRLAQWYVTASGMQLGQIAHLIGSHFAKGNETLRAVKWYGLAAQQAEESHQPDLASRLFEQALTLLPEDNEDMDLQIKLYEGFGRVLALQTRYVEAITAYMAVCIAGERLNDLLAQSRAWNAMVLIQIAQNHPQDALECARRAVEIAETANDKLALAQSYLGMSHAYISFGDGQSALVWGEKALDLSKKLDAYEETARALNLLGMANTYLFQYMAAESYFGEALALAQFHGNSFREAQIINNLAEVRRNQGKYRFNVAYMEKALEIAYKLNARREIITFTNNLGIALTMAGRYEQAAKHLTSVLGMVEDQLWWGIVGTYRYLAKALLGMGKAEEALEPASKAYHQALQIGNASDIGSAWQLLGQVAAVLDAPFELEGESITARQCFINSYHILVENNLLNELGHTLWLWAEYELQVGNQVGMQIWQEARTIFDQLELKAFVEAMDMRLPQ